MSDSDSDDFMMGGGSESDFEAPKKAPAKKAPAKAKAAPKVSCLDHCCTLNPHWLMLQTAPNKAPAKKPLATKKNQPNDSISENDDSDSSVPPKKKAKSAADGDENAGPSKPPAAGKPKDASDKYQKVCLPDGTSSRQALAN